MSTTLEGFASVVQPFLDLELVLQLGDPIKSGKEATVFRCVAHPKTGHDALALKVYRPRAHRSFKDDSAYREGSTILRFGGGNTRAARAMRDGTGFGRRVQGSTWCGREWEVLCRLHEAGLPVPAPVHVEEDAILMELFASADGAVAPQLSTARLDESAASDVFHAICGDVEDMLALNVLHGDLSPYNILWNGDAYRIIDFPQAMDPRFNSNAQQFLARDLENVAQFCARFGDVPDAAELAADIWQRFQRAEI
jgi:RIO kinase 1